jgi:hypothetical protein
VSDEKPFRLHELQRIPCTLRPVAEGAEKLNVSDRVTAATSEGLDVVYLARPSIDLRSARGAAMRDGLPQLFQFCGSVVLHRPGLAGTAALSDNLFAFFVSGEPRRHTLRGAILVLSVPNPATGVCPFSVRCVPFAASLARCGALFVG